MPLQTVIETDTETGIRCFYHVYAYVYDGRRAVRKLREHGWEIIDYGGPIGAYVVQAVKQIVNVKNTEGV